MGVLSTLVRNHGQYAYKLVREGAQKSEGFPHLPSRFPHDWTGDVENLHSFELFALTKKSVSSIRWSKLQAHEMCMEVYSRKSTLPISTSVHLRALGTRPRGTALHAFLLSVLNAFLLNVLRRFCLAFYGVFA